MSDFLGPQGTDLLLQTLQALQTGSLRVLHALGIAGDSHGQPAWPFGVRVSAEMIRFDGGHARRVALTLIAVGLALLFAAVGAVWRRRRRACGVVALLLLCIAPWPSTQLLFEPAYPTTFASSPTGFTPASIAEGQRVYARHCVACHGDDARGEGPLAATLPTWPPTLNNGLLWQRLDGELFWRIQQGLHDRHGVTTMPGFGAALDDGQTWAVIDFLQANAAGQSLRRVGEWTNPIHVPGLRFDCDGRTLSANALAGERLRIVALPDGAATPREDPRFMTVVLRPGATVRGANGGTTGSTAGTVSAGDPDAAQPAGCGSASPQSWNALAIVAGLSPQGLAGTQFIVDRQGWLRARSAPGQAGWSDADLVCRASSSSSIGEDLKGGGSGGDPLSRLIGRMDREPVQVLRGGFVH